MQQPAAATEAQIAGLLVGEALGDALGFLVEGSSVALCGQFVATVRAALLTRDDTALVERAHAKSIAYLQYSDDTQMTRELLQSLAACDGQFRVAHYAARLAALFRESRIVGCGFGTAKAAARLNRGVPWNKSGCKVGDAGNSSAIRAGPIGLLSGSLATYTQFATQHSLITHKDPRCAAAATAIAVAVAECRRPGPLLPAPFFTQVIAAAEAVSVPFATDLRVVADLALSDKTELAAARVLEKLGQDYDDGSIGISGFVTSSVGWALFVFVRHSDSYWAAVSAAIAAGGDTDSTAAMVGCLSGAHLGLAGVLEEAGYLARKVVDRGTWAYDDLVSLAATLAPTLTPTASLLESTVPNTETNSPIHRRPKETLIEEDCAPPRPPQQTR